MTDARGGEPTGAKGSASALRARRTGQLCLAVTAVGWRLNWPVMKALLREWPPLSARGWAGLAAALGLAALAALAASAWRCRGA